MTKDYPNWFAVSAKWYFEQHMPQFKDKKVNALQIGAYTGDASLWMVENVLNHPESRLFDVDTWLGSDEAPHKEFDWSEVEEVYQEKIADYIKSGKIIPKKMTSKEFLIKNDEKFDFVYIDGNHEAYAVLEDFILAWDHMNPGCIIAFDDYTWGLDLPIHLRPALAIDVIRNCYIDKTAVFDVGAQVWMRKL